LFNQNLHSFPTRRSSDLIHKNAVIARVIVCLFKIFISPPKLLFERLIVYKRANSRAKIKHQAMKQLDSTRAIVDLRGRTNLSKGDRKSTRLNSSHVKISY